MLVAIFVDGKIYFNLGTHENLTNEARLK